MNRFGDIKKYVKKIMEQDKRLTIITDPHIKIDPAFFVYNDGRDVVMHKTEKGDIL